jgi:peptidoglycan/LPS O-acetylase OafA/YrhL
MSTAEPKNNFDFIRLFAALCVLFSHQHALTGLAQPSVLQIHTWGGLGVLIFFSISGFLVAQSWEADPHLGRFTIKRLLRIWPAFAVVTLLCALVLGPLLSPMPWRDYLTHPAFARYFSNLYFRIRDALPMQFTGNYMPTAINGSLWTIPLELKCYAMLGLMGLIGILRFRLVIPTLLAIAAIVYFSLEPYFDGLYKDLKWSSTNILLVQFTLFFFAGVSFFYLRVHQHIRWGLIALFLAWIAAGISYMFGKPLLVLWFCVPTTALVLGNMRTPVICQAGKYGDLSYGIYIYAFPVQQTCIWLLQERIMWWPLLGVTTLSTLAFAFFSWHLVEKNALRFKPKRSS